VIFNLSLVEIVQFEDELISRPKWHLILNWVSIRKRNCLQKDVVMEKGTAVYLRMKGTFRLDFFNEATLVMDTYDMILHL